MEVIVGLLGVVLIGGVLWEAFETIILPRRVNRQLRFTRIYYRNSWRWWAAIGRRLRRRETWLSIFGPLSLLLLLALWAAGLIVGFALVQWGSGSYVYSDDNARGFGTDVYMSGTTFFTLGLGDVTPHTGFARVITVLEGGTGFGFLGLVITYLPVIYQSFSRREAQINLLDARSGSPPCGAELIRRVGAYGCARSIVAEITPLLTAWEQWCAELLENSFSYPALMYFRSQHENQSWIATLTTIMDACALLCTCVDDIPQWQVRMTFAIARHTAVDLAQYVNAPPVRPRPDRLPAADFAAAMTLLAESGIVLRLDADREARLTELRFLYEPFVNGLATRLVFALPAWLPAPGAKDNWETTAWDNAY